MTTAQPAIVNVHTLTHPTNGNALTFTVSQRWEDTVYIHGADGRSDRHHVEDARIIWNWYRSLGFTVNK